MSYNATVYRYTPEGAHVSTFVAEVDGEGMMLRSNSVQCTGLEGTPAYDAYVRAGAFSGYALQIVRDGAQGYRKVLTGMALPPAYIPAEPSVEQIRAMFTRGQRVQVDDKRGGYRYEGTIVRYERNGCFKVLDPADGTYCDHRYDALTAA